MNRLTVSVIVPVAKGAPSWASCASALRALSPAPLELIVVLDGPGAEDALEFANGFSVVRLPRRSGPAAARNLGAATARGDVLFFVDADVVVPPDAVARVTAALADAGIDAVIGSYDAHPPAAGLVSQYKNLAHRYLHQRAPQEGFTFWGACGAVRREAFVACGGFDERYEGPSIEDIELGYRLRQRGSRIRIDRALEVTHLKQWTLASLVQTDVLSRAVPWSALVLREGRLDSGLNLGIRTRAGIALAWLAMIGGLASTSIDGAGVATLAVVAALVLLDASLWHYFVGLRGLWFTIRIVPLHWLYYVYSGAAFAYALLRHAMRGLSARSEETAV